MEFRGGEKWAQFEGNVQGIQLNSRVLCQTMQVTLDREVWLNQTQRTNEKDKSSPKIERVVCDRQPRDVKQQQLDLLQPVTYSDLLRENGKIVRYQSVSAPELIMDNVRSKLDASGPGIVRIFQPGNAAQTGPGMKPMAPAQPMVNANPVGKPGANGAKTDADKVMKLTWVSYRGRLTADNKRRTATFFDNIEVMHFPTENPNAVIDVTKVHPDGMHLRCDESLEVYSHKMADNTTSMEMIATKNCRVVTLEFHARADVVKYDESKDTLIFEGRDEEATLYRIKDGVQGRAPEQFRGKKITYYRKLNNFNVEGGTGVTGAFR